MHKLVSDFFRNYNKGVKKIGEGSGYAYNGVQDLSIHFRKINLNRGASYIALTKWLQSKKAVIHPQNHNGIYSFSYAITISFYHTELGNNLDRINNNSKECVKRLNWKNIDFPASVRDYAFFEKNNEDIALNVLYVPFNQKMVRQEYISKHNFTRNKQVVLLKITDNEKWHFTALKSIRQEDNTYKPTDSFSRLMRNIASTSHEKLLLLWMLSFF